MKQQFHIGFANVYLLIDGQVSHLQQLLFDVTAPNAEYYPVAECGRLTSRTALTGFHQYSKAS